MPRQRACIPRHFTGERLIHADGAHDLYVENVQFTGLESAMNVVDVSASGLVWFDETMQMSQRPIQFQEQLNINYKIKIFRQINWSISKWRYI